MSVNQSSGHDRLNEITGKIRNSKFTFHDLSRHKASRKGEFARFNMPFELGIDFGCFQFARGRGDKVIALIDSDPHNYDQHLSDMSGRDILYHHNNGELLFEIIPSWLRLNTPHFYDGPKKLKGFFIEWEDDYKRTLRSLGYDLRRKNTIDLNLYHQLLEVWAPKWKKANKYILH